VALFALVVSLVVANVSFFNGFLVKTEVDRLCNVIRYLQRCAMVENKNHVLVFDEKNQSYSFDSRTYKLSKQVTFGFLSGAKGPPSKPSKAIDKSITFKDAKIICYSDGIIQSGMVYITDAAKKNMYAISCAVAKVSYVRIYKFNKKWTLLS